MRRNRLSGRDSGVKHTHKLILKQQRMIARRSEQGVQLFRPLQFESHVNDHPQFQKLPRWMLQLTQLKAATGIGLPCVPAI
jgi:hypothetical protein